MSIQVKEVSKFDKGLHGSISEQDISPEAASLSLNIDPNSEYGALRGIYGDKILSANGWEPPRRFTFNMEFFNNNLDANAQDGLIQVALFEKKYFMVNTYDKQYLLVFVLLNSLVETYDSNTGTGFIGGTAPVGEFANNIGISPNAFADTTEYNIANDINRSFNVIPVFLENSITGNGTLIKVSDLASAVKTSLQDFTKPSGTLQDISGFDNYFTCYRPDTSNDKDGRLVAQSNFYGDIGIPFLPKIEFPTGGNILGWQSSDTAGLRLPDHSIYSNPTSYIKGNGFTPPQSFDGTDGNEEVVFDFIKIKAFNSKGNLNILGVTKSQQVQLFESAGLNSETSAKILGSVSISESNSVSIEQRNKNLYLGVGDNVGSSSLWIGYISRNQLGKDIEGYQLEKASLETISPSTSSFNYDNIVTHTLHHGLNYRNGGIAGAASLYCDKAEDGSDVDHYGTNITSGSFQRTVNGWVKECLDINAGTDPTKFSDFKLGMIFRVNLGAALVAGDIGTAPSSGLSAFDYLRELKQIAKGDFSPTGEFSNHDEGSLTGKGGTGEALHDGDLFQLVHAPSQDDGDVSNDIIDHADNGGYGKFIDSNNTSNMFRLVYVGSLFGKEDSGTNHPSFADSDDAYCGIPAYAYAHINDGETLHRVKLSSRPDLDFESLGDEDSGISTIATSSDGLFVSKNNPRVDSINLRIELGVSDFVIGTIAECKSCDGEGGFGGEISSSKINYFTGHGKLWVTNKNEHNFIYLVDVTNWDRYNSSNPRLKAKRIELNFGRIHRHLISDDSTDYGNGLIRLWETQNGVSQDDEAHFQDYTWSPEPDGQYIASVCETYSHLPHMGDGALGGENSGDGKWRVWVEYKKTNNAAHYRYDLFLFNFRPQGWDGGGSDTGEDLSGDAIVHMFDKTPPYQECQKVSLSANIGGHMNMSDKPFKTIYYPFEKFAIKEMATMTSNGNFQEFLDSNWGRHSLIRAKGNGNVGSTKLLHNASASTNIVYDNLLFRNPSGEIHCVTPGLYDWAAQDSDNDVFYRRAIPTSKIWLGCNLGWVLDDGREYVPVRHTLKPYYKKWYFTGDTGSTTIPHAEEDNYMASGKKTFTAHVVSSFGKLSGKFVKDGGSLASGRERENDFGGSRYRASNYRQWFSRTQGELEHYDNQYTMFTLHDSPVAIETYSVANTPYEVQGKPMIDHDTETIYLHKFANNDHRTRIYQNDTEAGFMGSRTNDETGTTPDTINHSSVSATMGYSKYNQYRYHHANNGTDNVASDTATTGENESYSNGNTYGYGGQYHGQDGFGHYVNITQTWACNQDYIPPSHDIGGSYRYIDGDYEFYDPSNYLSLNFRSHGWGDGARFKNSNHRGTNPGDQDGRWWDGNYFKSSVENESNATMSRHGTGYFTYGPNQEGTLGIGYHDRYRDDVLVSDSSRHFKLKNSLWHNRRIVHCWSTTCLTDSVLNYNFLGRGTTEEDTNGNDKSHFDHREWGLWKTPRCSFRKLVIPSTFGTDADLRNVDIVSWSERNVVYPNKNTHLTNDQVKVKSGFLLSFKLPNANVSDLDNSATGVIVYEPKNSTYFTYRNNPSSTMPFDDVSPKQAHSKAAIDFLRSLYFTVSIVDSDSSTTTSNWNIYSNTDLITKNIVPGLSDDTSSNYSGGNSTNRREQAGTCAFQATNDVYCPVTISQDGSESKQTLGIWYRAQFTETPSTQGFLNGMTTREYPYYVFDRFWNYWSVDENTGFDRGGNTANQFITEGWGSTAGVSANFDNADDAYPTGYEGGQTNNALLTTSGAHVKKSSPALLALEGNDPDAIENPEFPPGQVYYKFSFLYDGFQESPLSLNAFPIDVEEASSLLRLKLTISSAEDLGLNSRVTHLNIYRKNNPKELYRLVRSVNLSNNKDSWTDEDGYKVLNFNDEQRMASYEGINGVPESLTNFTPNYRLSCQLNDFLFVGGIYHPNIEDGDHLLLRSKQGRFSVFDWSNDFLDIPTKPVAMAAFANRIWVFDNNNIFKINPTGLYIEDRTEGIGILNSDSYIVTDMGMFWCDRNNIYKHDGQKINQIGTSILKNHANPEWQLGYVDAVNKSEKLGYTPRIGYDPINQCIYISVQGFSKSLLSYKKYDGRIYSYDIKQDRWDYYDSPAVKTMTTDSAGNVLMSDGFQIYNYRRDKKAPKSFSWDSKTFQLGSANYKKTLKSLKFNGDLCLWRFNNSANLINETALDDLAEEVPEFEVGDNEHQLEVTGASESDDLKVYVDGILQTMRIKNKNPVIGRPIGNDSTGEIYAVETHLPNFGTKGFGMTYEDSFSLSPNSCPEFLTWPNSQFQRQAYEGELLDLMHLHRGMYIYFRGTDEKGMVQEEIVRIRDIKFNWFNTSEGINDLNTGPGAIEVRTWRGQLGTKAYDWTNENMLASKIEPLRPASPTFLFPRGTKGNTVKISLQNQKSFIDSFAMSYRVKRFK